VENNSLKMLGRLLAMLLRNPFNSLGKNQQLIESLSETRLIRRAAQITVGIFNSIKAGRPPPSSSSSSKGGFLSTLQDELEKEMKKKQLK